MEASAISRTALDVEWQRLQVIANNLANANTTRTAEGGVLIARMNGPTNIMVMDERGSIANIAIYDVRDKNGIMHVVDHTLEPGGPSRQVASNKLASN